MNPLPLLLAELRRSRFGLFAMILLVAIAVAFGVALTAVERGFRQGSAAAADAFDLVVGAPGSSSQLVLSAVYLEAAALPLMRRDVLARLDQEKGVAWYSPIGFGDRYRAWPVIGVTAPFVTLGGRRPLATGRVFAAPMEAVIGADVDLPLDGTFAPHHGLPFGRPRGDHPGSAKDEHAGSVYRVVGRLPRQGSVWDRAILVPIESVWLVHGFGTGHDDETAPLGPPWSTAGPGVPAVVVKPRAIADAYTLRGRYRGEGTIAVFPAEVLTQLFRTLGEGRALLGAVAFATQALVMAAVFLALAAMLAGRRRMLAVLRALGAPRAFVFLAVWLQGAAIVVTGAGLGLGLGYGLAALAARALESEVSFAIAIAPAWPELLTALYVAGAGLAAAMLPAAFAYRRPVGRDLRDG